MFPPSDFKPGCDLADSKTLEKHLRALLSGVNGRSLGIPQISQDFKKTKHGILLGICWGNGNMLWDLSDLNTDSERIPYFDSAVYIVECVPHSRVSCRCHHMQVGTMYSTPQSPPHSIRPLWGHVPFSITPISIIGPKIHRVDHIPNITQFYSSKIRLALCQSRNDQTRPKIHHATSIPKLNPLDRCSKLLHEPPGPNSGRLATSMPGPPASRHQIHECFYMFRSFVSSVKSSKLQRVTSCVLRSICLQRTSCLCQRAENRCS